MAFTIKFSDNALKDLKKMDKHQASLITGWIKKNLNGCIDPRKQGKPLVANRNGQWRYRIGKLRIIAEIKDNELIILIVDVGHRKNIYNN